MYYDFGDGKGLVQARIHSNGGGYIALTANVDDSVFIGTGCFVFGYARIKDRVRVTGKCRISGVNLPGNISTLIEDDVVISGQVVIEGHVLMRDHAQARNFCKLSGGVAMMHRSQVGGRATLAGDVYLFDRSGVFDDVTIISSLKKPLELRSADYLGGNKIIKNKAGLEKIIEKIASKRRIMSRGMKDDHTREPHNSQVSVLRQASLMPTAEDFAAINFTQPKVIRAAYA